MRKEIAELMVQHEGIRSCMRSLLELLGDLQLNQRAVPLTALKDRIGLYRWSLYDFQETIMLHKELDERIFETLRDRIFREDIIREHEEIRKQTDNLIRLARKAVYHKLCQKDLNKCGSDIVTAANTICGSIEEHMAKEERALKQLAS